MTKEEVLQHDKKFRYMLLSRMQSDCEYYLNYGNRNPKRLWAGDEQRQIEYMILLHDSFKEDEKPQWLSLFNAKPAGDIVRPAAAGLRAAAKQLSQKPKRSASNLIPQTLFRLLNYS